MTKRYLCMWFRYLKTDWFTLKNPGLAELPFVLSTPDHGRMVITSANEAAQHQGIDTGMAVADARAIMPGLQVLDDEEGLALKLLNRLAEWSVRYSPFIAVDLPDGLIIDMTGCAHLWGGEELYLQTITDRFSELGFTVKTGLADTIGAAWAVSRYRFNQPIVEQGKQAEALMMLPPAALRIDLSIIERLHKLGLRQIRQFMNMTSATLRRRFGPSLILRLGQALGTDEEFIEPVMPIEPYTERLPCLEPIATRTGIEIALERLLEQLSKRLLSEGKGLRTAVFSCFRIDGKTEEISIGTNRPSTNIKHLLKLFEEKIDTIEPALGIELFVLKAPKVEDINPSQQQLWETSTGLANPGLAELLDRFAGKFGNEHIHRYVPDEHYWPERAIRAADSLTEQEETTWRKSRPRPMQLLHSPERIDVTAPIPDYPPMMFRYRSQLHKIIRADGPERIEQEWWLQQGEHRDYYYVEDEAGGRYWLFRLGHYDTTRKPQWFLHGFFA